LVKSKTTKPFKKTGHIEQIDEKHYEETNRGRKVEHYKSKLEEGVRLRKQDISSDRKDTE